MQNTTYDIIVVGGGHAGVEAAWSAANMGSQVLLVTLDIKKIALMPCNPSIGGVGKGHIVFEISALGGLMPQLCSTSYLQARMLNTKKGPAVQGLRLQIDKDAYSKQAGQAMLDHPNITIAQEMVDEIVIENKHVQGIKTAEGNIYASNNVVLTTGTFLRGVIHVGEQQYQAGRQGEQAAIELSNFLTKLNLKMGRLKTGTPPRIKTTSIDFSKLEKQEAEPLPFLYELQEKPVTSSHDCYIARTNTKAHEIIRNNLQLSAMYSGNISGVGPRYCPSIEDKIARFAHKESHHIFVEPETKDYSLVYPSGISTSMPKEIQEQFIHSIEGFEHAEIVKYGYAVEYDFIHPDQLQHSLEVSAISGLFLAGQINGTTGYEEAAGQGMIAGINAHQKAHGKDAYIPDRNTSYIGVMIDDLVSMGVDEPYRMFTSRAERRLILRQDNAFLRLTEQGYKLGCVSQDMYTLFCKEKNDFETGLNFIQSNYRHEQIIKVLEEQITPSKAIQTLYPHKLSARTTLSIFAELKYGEYIKREKREIEKVKKYQTMHLANLESFQDLPGLSKELQQKILRYKPKNIAQAARIPGMTPAAVSLLILASKNKTRSL